MSDLFCILINNKGKKVMKYQPLNDYVLVRVVKEDEKTKGGLYKPAEGKEQMKGEVVAVGSGIYTSTGTLIPMNLKVHNIVIVPNTGIQLKLDGEKYNMYREQEILMIINE